MTKYATLLKAKLQELLSARGLPIDGTKEVLIERLEESDKIAAELEGDDEDDAATVPAVVEESKEAVAEAATTEGDVSAAVTESATETETAAVVEEETKPVEPEVTPETLKAGAVELLNRKIARAQKFGEDAQVSTLKADLARVEKFGVALDSGLARELGYAPAKPKSNNKDSRPRNFNNRNHKNRGGRPNNRPNRPNRPNREGRPENRAHVQQGRVYKTR